MAEQGREFKPQTTDGLMRHLRNECGVNIRGSVAKRKLQNIGFYHGYKGYRFAKTSRTKLPIQSFSEIEQLFLFDMRLKTLLYPWLMRIETSFKNAVLESICDDLHKRKLPATYDSVCRHCLTGGSVKGRYETHSYLSGKIAKECNNKDVLNHFTSSSREIPIWALLEVLTLGEFIRIYEKLSIDIKDDIYAKLGLPKREWDKSRGSKRDTTDYLAVLMYALTSLRNCVAHNAIIADARFSVRNKPDATTKRFLAGEFGTDQIQFDDLTDYVLIAVFVMTALKYTKTDRKQLVSAYELAVMEFGFGRIRPEVFNRVVSKSVDLKVKAAFSYIKCH